jgi:hypothetical protein
MRDASRTGRGALAMLFALHESSFRVPFGCYIMAAHRVLGLTPGHASHVRKCPRCNESPSALRGPGSSSTTSSSSMSEEWTLISMLMDHIPRCPCSCYVIRLRDRIVRVLEEFMAEAGAVIGRDSRLEVRRIRSGAFRDRHLNVVWQLESSAPHRHLVVDVTVTSARTNSNVPSWGLRLCSPSISRYGSSTT